VSDTRHSRGLANGLASDNKVGVPPSGPPIAVLCEDTLGLSFTGTGSWCLRKKSSSKVFTPGLQIRNPGFLIVRCKAIVANFGGIVHGCTEADLFKTDICKKKQNAFPHSRKSTCFASSAYSRLKLFSNVFDKQNADQNSPHLIKCCQMLVNVSQIFTIFREMVLCLVQNNKRDCQICQNLANWQVGQTFCPESMMLQLHL